MTPEQKIDMIINRWYNKDEKLISDWYSRPWFVLEKQHLGGEFYSPSEMIEAGQAEEVLKLLELFIL